MPQYQEIHDLAGSLIERVTQSTESWRAFLNSAAYTYNYTIAEYGVTIPGEIDVDIRDVIDGQPTTPVIGQK